MKLSLSVLVLASSAALVGLGCADKKKPADASASSPLDVTPAAPGGASLTSTPTAYAPPPAPAAYVPPPAPTADEWDATAASPAKPARGTARTASRAEASAGSSYTVQKGDTLYKIAKDRYGDGRQYAKIAAANPGVDPGKLKVGQRIVLP